MARPAKQGVDYFPLDVYMDDKFKFIEIKFGLEGFAIVIKLLQKIYSCGYWTRWTEDEVLLFSDEAKSSTEKINAIVQECLKREIFDEKLFIDYSILTSKGIQKRYKEIVKRRKDVEIVPEYTLIDDIMPTECKHDEYTKSTSCEHDEYKSTQSKVKERKVNNNNTPPATQDEPSSTLTPMKDDLADHYQTILTSVFPASGWGNFGKERKMLQTLAKNTKALMRDTPYENEKELANAIFKTFGELRKYGKGEYWQKAPVTPSGLVTRWSQVVTSLAEDYSRERDYTFEEAIF